jgi:hypothetical protein
MLPLFQNRNLLIATKHNKERVIAPILEKELGVKCFVDAHFDTDELGTFTGEVERQLDPVATVREKCLRALQKNNCDLAIASEGSFGPHPSMFFISADDELLMLIDTKNQLEILVRELSTNTNFGGKKITQQQELLEFSKHAGFPEHALILRKSKEENTHIYKGIQNRDELLQTFELLVSKFGAAFVETDMRAMFNPTRMRVIESATFKLMAQIKSTCPNCEMPGFGITDVRMGLPCDWCGSPTQTVLSAV